MNYNYPPGLEGVGPYWEDEKPSILKDQFISPRHRRMTHEKIKTNDTESSKDNKQED